MELSRHLDSIEEAIAFKKPFREWGGFALSYSHMQTVLYRIAQVNELLAAYDDENTAWQLVLTPMKEAVFVSFYNIRG